MQSDHVRLHLAPLEAPLTAHRFFFHARTLQLRRAKLCEREHILVSAKLPSAKPEIILLTWTTPVFGRVRRANAPKQKTNLRDLIFVVASSLAALMTVGRAAYSLTGIQISRPPSPDSGLKFSS